MIRCSSNIAIKRRSVQKLLLQLLLIITVLYPTTETNRNASFIVVVPGWLLVTATATERSVFNEDMILHHPYYDESSINNENPSPFGGELATDSSTNYDNDHRNLFLFGTATGSICSLTEDQFTFLYDPMTNRYVWDGNITDQVYSTIHPIWNTTILQYWNESSNIQSYHKNRTNFDNNNNNTTTTSTNPKSISVRACLCTQYLDRPIEFCSAEYYSCSVKTTPITCFTLSSTHTFIQSFWPVTIFWMIFIVYVFSCSESGRTARQYIYRKYRICCCILLFRFPRINDSQQQRQQVVPRQEEEDQRMVDEQLNFLIEHRSSYIKNLLREYVYRLRRRERYESVRQNSLWYRTYQYCIKQRCFYCFRRSATNVNQTNNDTQPTAIETNQNEIDGQTNNNVNDPHEIEPVSSPQQEQSPPISTIDRDGPRLVLKTKVYTKCMVDMQYKDLEDGATANDDVTTSYGGDDDTRHGQRCAICLLPLQPDVDIVGDLPCQHYMHKQCLKDWLARKNRCPLCQLSHVAEFHPSSSSHSSQ